jgi:type IV pilus assembly protein PilE
MTNSKPNQRGFSLIELMIVVVIIAVLAAIALPAYQRHVVATRRATAAACLTEMAQFMERHYTDNLTYVGGNAPAATLQCRTDLVGQYTFAFNGAVTATAFAINAVPAGRQATLDTGCGTLGMNQSGTKAVSGASGVAACW